MLIHDLYLHGANYSKTGLLALTLESSEVLDSVLHNWEKWFIGD